MGSRLTIPLVFALLLVLAVDAEGRTGQWVVATDRLNLRQCPSVRGCAVLTILQRDSRLEVLARTGEWLQVRVHPTPSIGWVHSGYTRPIAAPAGGQGGQRPASPRPSVVETVVNKVAPFLLFGAVLFGLGYSGRVLRRGVKMQRELISIRSQIATAAKPLNEEKWNSAMRGAKLRIVIPCVFWTLLYATLYNVLPTRVFFYSLAGLLLPVMGYVGFFLVPSLESLVSDD